MAFVVITYMLHMTLIPHVIPLLSGNNTCCFYYKYNKKHDDSLSCTNGNKCIVNVIDYFHRHLISLEQYICS